MTVPARMSRAARRAVRALALKMEAARPYSVSCLAMASSALATDYTEHVEDFQARVILSTVDGGRRKAVHGAANGASPPR